MGRTVPKKTKHVQNNTVGAKKKQRGQVDGTIGNAKRTQKTASPRATSSPQSVVHFVYSEAVISAVKYELHAGPVEEGRVRAETNPRQTNVEIMKLPDIYQHVVSVGLDRLEIDGTLQQDPSSGKQPVDASRNLKQGNGAGKVTLPPLTVTSPRLNKYNAATPVKSDRKQKTDTATLSTN